MNSCLQLGSGDCLSFLSSALNFSIVVGMFIAGIWVMTWASTVARDTAMRTSPERLHLDKLKLTIDGIGEKIAEVDQQIADLQEKRTEAMDKERKMSREFQTIQAEVSRRSTPSSNIVYEIGYPEGEKQGILYTVRGPERYYPFNGPGSRDGDSAKGLREIDILIWSNPDNVGHPFPEWLERNATIVSERKFSYAMTDLV